MGSPYPTRGDHLFPENRGYLRIGSKNPPPEVGDLRPLAPQSGLSAISKAEIQLEKKRALVESTHPRISLERQCDLLGLSRPNWHYEPREMDPWSEVLIRLIDQQHTDQPVYGVRRDCPPSLIGT